MNRYIIRNNKESKYYSFFDKQSGITIREEYGQNNPFMRYEGPELLDISITNYCENNCTFCYRKSSINGKHMNIKDYRRIIEEASRIGVFQVALGGGNPNQHPNFIEFLKMTYEQGIIPSYTTNGQGLSDEILQATKKYCGAVAVSLYEPYNKSYDAIKKLISEGIKTNIHFILNSKTIENAIELLENIPEEIKGINAIIFLNYKPQKENDILQLKKSNKIKNFFYLINNKELPFKIGFDSCSISFLVKEIEKLNENSVDYCEAGRFSAFISEELRMFPCSFLINNIKGENLNESCIKDVWRNSKDFKNIRLHIENNNCSNCRYFKICHGGCRIFDINEEDCIN